MRAKDYGIRAEKGRRIYWWTGREWVLSFDEAKAFPSEEEAGRVAKEIPAGCMENLRVIEI